MLMVLLMICCQPSCSPRRSGDSWLRYGDQYVCESDHVQSNMARLKALGVEVMEAEHGVLASGKVGRGRMVEPGTLWHGSSNASPPHRYRTI
jgi:hypothetical protein